MTIGRLWAGRIFGTNTGNIFVRLTGPEESLSGTLHINEPGVAVAVYQISGSFDGQLLEISGKMASDIDGVKYGALSANARLNADGNLDGEWNTTIGTAGTFILFPHDREALAATNSEPEQLYTARHNFGPIVMGREDIISLADEIQRSLPNGRAVVTFASGTEQARYLEDFRKLPNKVDKVGFLKIFARQSDAGDIDRAITVEFGPSYNWAMAQGPNEAWALGELEKLKRQIKKYERVYAARNIGVGINQFMLACTVVFLPSLPALADRAILMSGVVALIYGVNWLHSRFLPHATVYLTERTESWIGRLLPSFASWFIGIAASVTASLLGAYLKGWLDI